MRVKARRATCNRDDQSRGSSSRSLIQSAHLIGPRPAVLQNMLAELGEGVLERSVFFSDTAARVKRSLPPIFMTVYGSEDAHPGRRGYVTKGFPCPKAVPAPAWRVMSVVFNPVAAFLTTGGLPPQARELLDLPWSERQERRYQRFAALWRSRPVNWVRDHLPMPLRYNRFARAGYARV
jgi:uncharacterized protein (DUF2236 family)